VFGCASASLHAARTAARRSTGTLVYLWSLSPALVLAILLGGSGLVASSRLSLVAMAALVGEVVDVSR
jgi:hypothetical protein